MNFIANFLVENKNGSKNNGGEADLEVGFSDKVTISVKRVRWYGTINEEDNLSTLRLFNMAKLPIKVNGTSLTYLHLGVLIIGLFTLYKLNKSKKEEKWDSNLDGEHLYYS